MDYLKQVDVVVAGVGKDGAAAFLDVTPPCTTYVSGALEASFVWNVPGIPALPDIGGVPEDSAFPAPGGSRFGLVCFPPRAIRKLSSDRRTLSGIDIDPKNPAMHKTDSIDFEVVISGKIDIVLENGERRTLTPGSCLVMGGVMHAWENPYDEPCVFACSIIGARPSTGQR